MHDDSVAARLVSRHLMLLWCRDRWFGWGWTCTRTIPHHVQEEAWVTRCLPRTQTSLRDYTDDSFSQGHILYYHPVLAASGGFAGRWALSR